MNGVDSTFLGTSQAEKAGRELTFAAIAFAFGDTPHDALPGCLPQF